MTQTIRSNVLVKQVVFLTVNHREPLPLREVIHSTGETTVWRDPGGSWACLPPVYDYEWNHPATGYDTCRLRPEKHCEKKVVIRDVKKHKTTQKSFVEDGVKQDQNKTTTKDREKKRRTHEGAMLSTNMNSTTTKRTWADERARKSHTKKEKKKESEEKRSLRCPYNIKTTETKAWETALKNKNKTPKRNFKQPFEALKRTEPERRAVQQTN